MAFSRGLAEQLVGQPSLSNTSVVVIGGTVMPPAEVCIGARSIGNHYLSDLWEPSPPQGASPLIGSWQCSQNSSTVSAGVRPDVATKLELIVDRSGSMSSLHSASVEGLNRFLREQRALPHVAMMTVRLVVFDDIIEVPWPDGTPLTSPNLIVTSEMLRPRGMTALLDAIGCCLVGTPLLPPRVVCIVTDGAENSSKQHSLRQINDLIAARQQSGWTFIFLAANQDAIASGAALGINANTCATFSATPAGIAGGFGSASAASCRGGLFGSSAAAFSPHERAICKS